MKVADISRRERYARSLIGVAQALGALEVAFRHCADEARAYNPDGADPALEHPVIRDCRATMRRILAENGGAGFMMGVQPLAADPGTAPAAPALLYLPTRRI